MTPFLYDCKRQFFAVPFRHSSEVLSYIDKKAPKETTSGWKTLKTAIPALYRACGMP